MFEKNLFFFCQCDFFSPIHIIFFFVRHTCVPSVCKYINVEVVLSFVSHEFIFL